MNEPTLQIKGRVLEVTSDTYEGNPYGKVKLRSAEVAENKILSYSVNVKKVDMDVFMQSLDKDVTVQCGVQRGANESATLKIVGIVGK
jgi:hypothetical protein